MSQPIDKKTLYSMRYPKGTVIEFTEPIEDSYGGSKPTGSRFRVEYIDDMLQLHGVWLPPQSGSIAVLIEHDRFKIVK